jgi:hypothetical protein
LSPLVPILEAFPHLPFRRAGLETHEGVWEVIPHVIVLRREIVRLRLAFLPDEGGLRGVLVHVVRDRPHVVEELRVDGPLLVLRPDSLPISVAPHSATACCKVKR